MSDGEGDEEEWMHCVNHCHMLLSLPPGQQGDVYESFGKTIVFNEALDIVSQVVSIVRLHRVRLVALVVATLVGRELSFGVARKTNGTNSQLLQQQARAESDMLDAPRSTRRR